MNTPTAPIGIYVRVSRKGDREDDRFHSPKEQAERATALAAARGFVVGPTFEDIDVSGATPPAERPAMSRMLQAIHGGTLGGIAAFSLDRLSREPAHGDALVREVTKAGGIILTPDIPDAIDTPTGEFTFGMLLQVAKLYRSQARARFASAKERSIAAGIPVGPVNIGYRLGKGRVLELDPKRAEVVVELYERWVRGQGRNTLARLLDEHAPRPPREDGTPNQWSHQSVVGIIRNPIYKDGRLRYGDLVSDHAAGGIVDEALWLAAQAPRATVRPKRNPASRWLVTGLLKCAECGYNLTPTTQQQRRYRYYRCTRRTCGAAAVNADRMETWVVARSMAVSDEMEARSQEPELGDLEEALVAADRRYEQVRAPEVRDALGPDWAADVKARRLERDAAGLALGEARAAAGTGPAGFRLRDEWRKLSTADRRATLGLYWKEIRVGRRAHGGTPVTFVARGPHARAEVTLAGAGVVSAATA